MRRVPLFVLMVVLVSAVSVSCDRSRATSSATTSLCRSALGDSVLSEIPTTVGEARATRYGPGYAPAPNAFPAAASTDQAAWCWIATTQAGRVEPGSYTCFLVGPDSSKIEIVAVSSSSVPDRAPGAIIK